MILTATPYRISFLGGGSDYPAYLAHHDGAVLSATVNRYCRVMVRRLPPFFDFKTRVAWSKIEMVQRHEDIDHPVVRAVLMQLGIEEGLSIHHDGDLPARSGMGASSAFTVGFLHAVRALIGLSVPRLILAQDAIQIERHLQGEYVGMQDQVACAYGGMNRIRFRDGDVFSVDPVPHVRPGGGFGWLSRGLLIVYTGLQRDAATIAAGQVRRMQTGETTGVVREIVALVDPAVEALQREDLAGFGRLVDEGWQLKRRLGEGVSTDRVDAIYAAAKRAGAIGGKLLGAGGGGHMLFVVEPQARPRVVATLPKGCVVVPFEFEFEGSRIVYREED